MGTTLPPLGLDKRGRPYHLHRRIGPRKRGARTDATAKAEGAKETPETRCIWFTNGPRFRAQPGIFFDAHYHVATIHGANNICLPSSIEKTGQKGSRPTVISRFPGIRSKPLFRGIGAEACLADLAVLTGLTLVNS